MAIFCEEDLSEPLSMYGLSFRVIDLSKDHYEHLQQKQQVARRMKEAFEREGNRFIWENLMAESVADPEPFDPTRLHMRRSLYHVWI